MPETKLPQRKIARFGWKPDLPDHRDYRLVVPQAEQALPANSDLRWQMPPPYDQGNLGSCTSNAIGGMAQFLMIKKWRNPGSNFPISRLFLYYNERSIEGTTGQDAGAMLRDGMKAANLIGLPHEKFWPYLEDKFAKHPNPQSYYDARFHRLLSYQRVTQSHNDIVSVLSRGYCIVFGFTAFPALESDGVAATGHIPSPGPHDEPIGGHAVALVGHDDATKLFLIRNSWGGDWGMKGYATMPYDYVLNSDLCDDFWTSQMIS